MIYKTVGLVHRVSEQWGPGHLDPKRGSCYSAPASCCLMGVLFWLRFQMLTKVLQLLMQADTDPMERSRNQRSGLGAWNTAQDHRTEGGRRWRNEISIRHLPFSSSGCIQPKQESRGVFLEEISDPKPPHTDIWESSRRKTRSFVLGSSHGRVHGWASLLFACPGSGLNITPGEWLPNWSLYP